MGKKWLMSNICTVIKFNVKIYVPKNEKDVLYKIIDYSLKTFLICC